MTNEEMSTPRVPQACTLPTARQPLRIAEFNELFATALRGLHRLEPTRLRLTLDPSAEIEAAARELTARESQCCSFFSFEFNRVFDGLDLDVTVPVAYVAVLDGLVAHTNVAATEDPVA